MQSSSASVITGLLFTFGLVLVGALITALLLAFTDLHESSLPYFTYAINTLGLLIGGIVTGRRCGNRGWYYGGLTGLFYFILVLLIGFLGFDVPMQLVTLLYLAGAFILGALGGVIGVNMTNRR
ncbi:TIGR04086 family membrane protein [Brevibacillus humidisoli]|uniref:TIGR04086 family membrane protein n=1 Tax=Brevibacillus humidisoli TaxID=2895522 RepID=UPI001E28E851|nr:TIGR04086 family membrane protein [Brevibacillus humidisoli]UFJ39014.1 TIGR04086 family membrane protein [Brevibacillus humidisoli]